MSGPLDNIDSLREFVRAVVREPGQPSSLGLWVDVVPAITSVVGSSNTLAARWFRVGRFVHFRGRLTLGSGGSLSGSDVTIALPVAAVGDVDCACGSVIANDVGTRAWTGVGRIRTSDPDVLHVVFEGNNPTLGASSPFAWGDTDWLSWAVAYEAA